MTRTWSFPLFSVLLASLASCTRGEGSAASAVAAPMPDRRADPEMRVDRTSAPPEMRIDGKVASGGTSGPIAAFAQQLPDFTLDDPNGVPVTKDVLAKDGLVLVVTAPILANQTAQEGWAKALQDTRGGSKVRFAFLQDMNPSNFKDTARGQMRERYAPESGPILILDETGEVRRKLQVIEETTIVMAFDSAGKLVYVEDGEPSDDRAKMAWMRANGE